MGDIMANRELPTLVPASFLGDISCYLIWDEHPLDPNPFDVVVGTKKCEVIELKNRQIRSSVLLDNKLIPRDIRLYRNKDNFRFYVISTLNTVFVVAAEEILKIYKRFNNIDRYEISDPYASGSARLRIWYSDDAVPVTLNDNFEINSDFCNEESKFDNDGSSFVTLLRSKLVEAKHTVAVNASRLKNLTEFRQNTMYTILQDMCPNSSDSAIKSCEKLHEALIVEDLKPWSKLCNGKVVLGVNLTSNEDRNISNIKFLLQSNTDSCITYKSCVYSSLPFPPYWKKTDTDCIATNTKHALVAVTDMEEFSINNNIQYLGLVSYEMDGKEKFIPLQEIKLSCLETLSESFDVLSTGDFDESSFLAILSTTMVIKLNVHECFTSAERKISNITETFQTYLRMELVSGTDNVLIHRISPFHVLNGVMIIFEDQDSSSECMTAYSVLVYLRNKSQLSSLLHLISDGIPHRLIITPHDAKIESKKSQQNIDSSPDIMEVDECIASGQRETSETIRFGESLLKQTNMVLEYFDACIKSMAESKSAHIGYKIDVFAPGEKRFSEFARDLSEEIKRSSLI